jgi:hypothetical protein
MSLKARTSMATQKPVAVPPPIRRLTDQSLYTHFVYTTFGSPTE